MNIGHTTKIKKHLLFDIVINIIGIGVNVEGLTRVFPSTFSTEIIKREYINLMKVKPNYKLPSFRFGFMEVVTVAAQAVTASFLVKKIAKNYSFKKNSIFKNALRSITPEWINAFNTSLSTALSQTRVIGRMAYEKVQTRKLPQFFSNTSAKTMTTLCAASL